MDAKSTGDSAAVMQELKLRYGSTIAKLPKKVEHLIAGNVFPLSDASNKRIITLLVTNEALHLDPRYSELLGLNPSDADSTVIIDVDALQSLLCVRGHTLRSLIDAYKADYISGPSGSVGNWLTGTSSRYAGQIDRCPVLTAARDRLLPAERNPYVPG